MKKQFRKTDGRSYYHIVQAFSPDDPLDFETAHQIGLEFAQQFVGYQCIVATHMNTAHKHNHIILNSVNYETGIKFHQSAAELRQVKEFSNEQCRRYGLSVTETKADPFHIPEWKRRLREAIREALRRSRDRMELILLLEEQGYRVKWEDGHKYVTYTTPENMVCRDSKLFDQMLLRANLEHYFEMGGCEYLVEHQENGETLDDVVCALASIFQALELGDNDRFHLETIHHSKKELEKILAHGGKIEHAVQVVDDEEYEQYHGFSMSMM